MRPPIDALRPKLVEFTKEGRTKFADQSYDLDHVRDIVIKAALAGYDSVKLTQSGALNLRNTPAATRLKVWAEEMGLRLEWEARRSFLPDGREVQIEEPILSWQEPAST